MLILEISIAIALIASIVLFIRERIAAKRENRKMNPWYAVVLGVVIACAIVYAIGSLFLFLITWAIVVNM